MFKLDCTHPTLLLKTPLQRICEPFLKQHGLNYFQYLRCYNDGSFALLATNTGFFDLVDLYPNKPFVYSSFTQEHQNQHAYWFLWDEELPSAPVALVRERLKLYHGITLLRRAKHYYDMIAFAMPETRLNVASFYMSKYKILEQFIQDFDKNHQDILKQATQKPIIVSEPYRDVNYQKICLQKGRFEIQSPKGIIHITAQELACLRMLLQGQSYKHIAQVMQLSPRTVETYITRVKDRAGIRQREDLHRLMSICTG